MPTRARTGIFPGRVDPVSGGLYNIPHRHARIHDSRSFYMATYDNFGSNDTNRTDMNFTIQTPTAASGWLCHFNFKLRVSGGLFAEFYEAAVIDSAGNQLTCRNHDRNSSTASNLVIRRDSTLTSSGTSIWKQETGDTITDIIYDTKLTLVNSDEEMILKSDTTYLLYLEPLTSTIANVVCNTYMSWYEHQKVE